MGDAHLVFHHIALQLRAQLKQDARWLLSHATVIAVYFLTTAGETSERRRKTTLPARNGEKDVCVENKPPGCAPSTRDAPQQLINKSFKRSRAVSYSEVCTTEGLKQRDGERLFKVNMQFDQCFAHSGSVLVTSGL